MSERETKNLLPAIIPVTTQIKNIEKRVKDKRIAVEVDLSD